MDLNKIKGNAKNYTSFEAVVADVQWMLHNSWIIFAGSSEGNGNGNTGHANGNTKNNNYTNFRPIYTFCKFSVILHFPELRESVDVVEELLDLMKVEFESVQKCSECYYNASKHKKSWFEMACSQPHCIIWAKMDGYSFWPAKVMSVDEDIVHVRFFGEHSNADVSASKCFLYSEHCPENSRQMSSTEMHDQRSPMHKRAVKVSKTFQGTSIRNSNTKYPSNFESII